MTTNNDVKAPRPFTLPKHWEAEPFDSNKFKGFTILGDTVSIDCGQYKMPTSDPTKDIAKTLLEAIQAIASAQRPWLKAEGFDEFEQDEWYQVLYFEKDYPDDLMQRQVEFISTFNGECFDGIDESDCVVLAFKPVTPYNATPEKVQEAWDAVEGVEVWEVVK
jgi:hypothetical protein